jgi:glycerol-3-phosphate dehydrogenase
MKIAPHLVHPMPCLTPTFKKFTRSRLALGVALTLNDLLSFDRNSLPDPEKYLAGGRVISAKECAEYLPGYERRDYTGAAVWHDGHIYNSERLVLAFILSASQAGAVIANYVEAAGFLQQGNRITGVQARDVLTGEFFGIQAKVVINCTGAWTGALLNQIHKKAAPQEKYAISVALDLIVKQVWNRAAAGIPSQPGGKKRSQVLFIVPWRGKSMVGTWHIPWDDSPDRFQMNEGVIQDFLNEINSTQPGVKLSLADVENVHWGFLPADRVKSRENHVKLIRESQVIDHQKEDGVAGLLSIIGVKYTTARLTAEQAIDAALVLLGKTSIPSRTKDTPVAGGQIDRFQDYLTNALAEKQTNLDPEMVRHLVYTYGSDYKKLIYYVMEQPELGNRIDPSMPISAAEVVHAARHEMAQKLIDVIQRRTELGTTGLPTEAVLQKCAGWMGKEMGWDAARQQAEISEVVRAYPYGKATRSEV